MKLLKRMGNAYMDFMATAGEDSPATPMNFIIRMLSILAWVGFLIVCAFVFIVPFVLCMWLISVNWMLGVSVTALAVIILITCLTLRWDRDDT